MENTKMEKWVVIDGSCLLYKAYHTFVEKSQQTLKAGVMQGTLSLINKCLNDIGNVDHAIVIFDPKGGSLARKALYPEYKSQRPPRPEQINKEEHLIKQFLIASGIPVITKLGVESDDVMATIAKHESQDKKIGILSVDKDVAQFVGGNVYWFKPDSDGVTRMTSKKVFEKFGVGPDKIVDFLAIKGDAADNLPGLDGFGDVSTAKLLNAFGGLENAYLSIPNNEDGRKKLEDVVGKRMIGRLWKSFHSSKEIAFKMKELVQLDKNIDLSQEDYKTRLSVNDSLLDEMRKEYSLPNWLGYFLPWQKERAALMKTPQPSNIHLDF